MKKGRWPIFPGSETEGARATLRSHLVLLVFVTVVPFSVFSAITFYLFARDERAALENGLRETARALRQAVDTELKSNVNTLEALGTSEHLDRGDLPGFYSLCARVLKSQEGWKTIILHDPSGKELFNLLKPFGADPRPLFETKSFEQALRTKKPAFVGFLVGPDSGPSVGLRVPVLRRGEVQYVITAATDPRILSGILINQRLSSEWAATLFDQNNTAIARVPEPEKFLGQRVAPLLMKLKPGAKEGWLHGVNREAVASYAAFSRSEISGYTIALMVPASGIDAPLQRSLSVVAALGLLLLAAGTALAVVIGRRIAEPIKSLSRSAEALGRGEPPTVLAFSPVQEVETLRRSIEESGRLLEERRQADQARWESERRFAAIFNQSTAGIAQCDLEGKFLLVNDRYCEIVGRSREELMTMRLPDIIHPDDVSGYASQIERLMAGEARSLVERRYVCPNASHVWVNSGMSLIADAEGKPQYIVAVSQDITDRKRTEDELYRLKDELEKRVVERTEELTRTNAELFRTLDQREKLEAQLRHAQKMEAIGALAGGIAHDFNNILGIIAVHASSLSHEEGVTPEISEAAGAILGASQRAAALVHQLLTFAQEKPAEHKRVDLNDLISDLMKMMVNTFPRAIAFALDLDPAVPQILGDQNQLEQALLNLCLNARDAMAEGGKISIRTAEIQGDELHWTHPEVLEKRYLCVEVTDTGSGMDEETRNRLFEPFFTTKKEMGGTGLGLAVVYGIVENHRGFIDVQSVKGSGTTFRLYLPVRWPAPEVEEKLRGEIAHRNETVLIVEDERNLLALLESVLKKNGYRVYTAMRGDQAIDVYRANKEEIDLVLLDLGLPGINGRDVYAQLKEENPDVAAIVSTGYIDPEVRIELVKMGVNAFLQKPLTPQVVVQKIRSVLDRKRLTKRGKTNALAS